MISWIIQAITYIISWLVASFHAFSAAMIAVLFTSLSSALPSYDLSSWYSYFNAADYVFPLAEVMTMSVAWFALYVACFAYKLVKSWIPFVSS